MRNHRRTTLNLSRLLARTFASGAPSGGSLFVRPTVRAASGIAMALSFAALGGRSERRAALRGLSSMAVATVLFRPPVSSSVILNRAGRDAAFVTGVGIESLWLGAAAGVLSTALEPRGTSPRHRLTGALAGVGVAALGTMVWPRTDDSPAEAPVVRMARATNSSDGHGLTVVVNPGAGRSGNRDMADEIRKRLPAADLVMLDDTRPVADVFRDAASDSEAIGVIGGDGTVATAAAAAFAAGVPLLVFPGGTLNHFARDLGIDGVDDAIDAFCEGAVVEIDLGCIDGRLFLNTASFGSYSDFVDARERLEGRIGKWAAVAVALWQTVLSSKPVRVEVNGEERRIWMIFIGNCEYDPPGFAPATRHRLDDGQLDVRIVDGSRPGARLRMIVAVLTGQIGRSVVYDRMLVPRLDVSMGSDRATLAADGEIFTGAASFSIEKTDRRLAVFVPPRPDSHRGSER